jgi:hypothetical protein
VSPFELIDVRGGEGGGGGRGRGAKSYDGEKACHPINHSILSGGNGLQSYFYQCVKRCEMALSLAELMARKIGNSFLNVKKYLVITCNPKSAS